MPDQTPATPSQKKHLIELIRLIIVLALTGIIVPMVYTSYLKSQGAKHRNQCQENLVLIDGAKELWAEIHRPQPNDTPTIEDLLTLKEFKEFPKCPGGGTYTIGPINQVPSCSLSTKTDYPHTVGWGDRIKGHPANQQKD